MVQVVLRDSTSISPDCSAVKRSLADSGTNLTLPGSLKIPAAMARQTSTSIPVQLPLSSGDAKPGRPGLTPQDSMPRSWMALRVWAVSVCADRAAAAAARVRTRDARFMGKAFRGGVRGTLPPHVRNGPTPDDPCCKCRQSRQLPAILVEQWISGRGRPLNLQRLG